MPKKAKKNAKLAKKSDSDDDDDFKICKILKKKGQKIAISDSDDDFSPKPSTLKGKITYNTDLIVVSRIVFHKFHYSFEAFEE